MAGCFVEHDGYDVEEKGTGLLPVALRRHRCLDSVSEFVSASLHVESLSCVLVSRDGYLSVRWLDGRTESVSCLGRVQRCVWTSNKSPPTFVALTTDLRLVWVAVTAAHGGQEKEKAGASCSRVCYITPASIRRKLGNVAKDLSFKHGRLVGLQSNNDVVLLVDHSTLLVLSASVPGHVTAVEVEANVEVVSCCPLRLPSAHEFADPPVVIPTGSQPVEVKLYGDVAVVAWTRGLFFTFCNLERGEVMFVINANLTFGSGAAPLLSSPSGGVEFCLTPDLSHLTVACTYATPPPQRRHIRQGSTASRGSADDRRLSSNRSPFVQSSGDVRVSPLTQHRGGAGLHFVDIVRYLRQYPGHVSKSVVKQALESQSGDTRVAFPYLSPGNGQWDEEMDDITYMTPASAGLVGDAVWHRELAVLRRGNDSADAAHIGMVTGAGTLPRAFQNESETEAVMVYLQCLAAAHASPPPGQPSASSTSVGVVPSSNGSYPAVTASKSSLEHARTQSNIVLAALTAIESLVEQARLSSTTASVLQTWRPEKKCSWGDGFLPLPTSGHGHLVVADVVLSASTVAVLLLPQAAVVAGGMELNAASAASATSPSDLGDGALVVYSCHDGNTAVFPFSQRCLPVAIRHGNLPYCLLSSQQLFTVVYGLEQEDIVNRLILYENAVLAELLCRLNHWERCSLPLTALDSALRHKQLDSVAFFLNSQQGGSLGLPGDGAEEGAGKRRGAPKLAPAQVEIAIDLLTQAVEYSAAQQNYQYCQQLLHLALSFLNRLMDAALTRVVQYELAEDSDSENDDSDVQTARVGSGYSNGDDDESDQTPVGSLSGDHVTPTHQYRSLLSAESRTARLRVLSESSTTEDLVDSLSVDKLGTAVARLRKFVKTAGTGDGAPMLTASSLHPDSAANVSATSAPDLSQQSQQLLMQPQNQNRLMNANACQWPANWAELEEEEVIHDGILTSQVSTAQAFLVQQARHRHLAELDLASTSAALHSDAGFSPDSRSMPYGRASTPPSKTTSNATSSCRSSVSSSRSSSVVPFGRISARNSPQISHRSSYQDARVIAGSRQSPAMLSNSRDSCNLEQQLQDAMLDGDSPAMGHGAMQRQPSTDHSVGSGNSSGADPGMGTAASSLTRVLSQEYCTPAVNAEPWRDTGLFRRILAVGADMVLHSLLDRNFALAMKILENLGCNVREHLRRICLHTVSRPLRDYLVEELSRQQWLADEELHVVRYARLLERLYPFQSFSSVEGQLLAAAEASVTENKRRLPVNLNNLGLPTRSDLLMHLHTPGDVRDTEVGHTSQMDLYPTASPVSASTRAAGVSSASGGGAGAGAGAGSGGAASGGYAQVSLDFVRTWLTESRERVLLEQLASGWNSSARANVDWSKLVCANSEWRYHLHHLNESSIIQCIQQWIPSLQDAVNASSRRTSVSMPTSPAPAPVMVLSSTDLWHGLELCPRHVRELVADELASRGLFSDGELENFNKLMRRLSRNQLLFHRPHALQAVEAHAQNSTLAATGTTAAATAQQNMFFLSCDDRQDQNSMAASTVVAAAAGGAPVPAILSFHRNFVSYCVEHRLANVLYRYLNYHRLARTEKSAANLGLDVKHADKLWLACLTAFRLAANDPMDASAIFRASLANAHMCLANMVDGGEGGVPLNLMLSTNHQLMALGTLMFVPGGLDELLDRLVIGSGVPSPSGSLSSHSSAADSVFASSAVVAGDWPVDIGVVRDAVQAYPQLRAAIFPVSDANKTPAQLQDITLYHLLQGNSPFNADRLFRWQATNTLPLPDDDDFLHDLPHFAHPGLVAKYGHIERLSFLHYLRQGQASLALNTFIAHHHFEGAVGKQSVERATNRALRLALRHFADAKIVSACAAFWELLGRDSLRVRVTVEAANRVLTYTGHGVVTGAARSRGPSPAVPRKPDAQQSSVSAALTASVTTSPALTGAVTTTLPASSTDAQRPVASAQLKGLLGADAVCKDQATIAKDFISLEARYQSSYTNGSGGGSSGSSSSSSDVLRYVEAATHVMITQHHYGTVSVEAAYCWHLVISFCRLFQLPLSVEFLRQCAEESEWLPLVCHAQQHQFEPDLALEVIDRHFADADLREHLRLAFVNMEATPELTRRTRSIPPPVLPPKSTTLFEEDEKETTGSTARPRDVRAKFYSRVGLQGPGVGDATDPVFVHASLPDSAEGVGGDDGVLAVVGGVADDGDGKTPVASVMTMHLSPPRSLADVIASSQRHNSTGSASLQSLEPVLVAQHATNTFEALLACSSADSPPKTLLAHCIALENPLLAVLAACYEGHDVMSCFCAWLCATCGPDLLADALPSLSDGSVHWRSWSCEDLLLLVLSAIDHRPARTRALVFACEIFDKENIIAHLLSFHEQFVILNNVPLADLKLKRFVELSTQPHPLEGVGRLKLPVPWLQDLSVRLVRSTLCRCTSPSQRRQLVAILADRGFGRSYTCRVPDFSRLHQLISILHTARLDTDLAFSGTVLIKSSLPAQTPCVHPGPATTHPFSPDGTTLVGNHAQVMAVEALLDDQFFAEARSYALLVGVGVDLVTCSQVSAFCDDMRRSSLWQAEERRIGFWHKCSDIFRKNACSPAVPAEFFSTEMAKIEARSSQKSSQSQVSGSSAERDGRDGDACDVDDDSEGPPTLFSVGLPPPPVSLKEKTHILCLQLYWQRQCCHGEDGSGHQAMDEVNLHALEQKVWMCRFRAEVADQAGLKRQSTSNSLLPAPLSVTCKPLNPVLAPSEALMSWSMDSSSLTRLLDDLMEDKALELRQGTPTLVDPTQHSGQLFEGRGWADKLLTDMTYQAWRTCLAANVALKNSLTGKELSCLELIQDRLLSSRRFTQACSVAVMFGHASHDLEILLSAIRLVRGLTTAAELSDTLEADVLKKKRRLSSVSSSSSSSAASAASSAAARVLSWRPPLSRTRSQSSMADWLRSCGAAALEATGLLQELTERSTSAKICCAQVTVAFHIAKFLDAEYDAVISGSALLILSKLLASPLPCAFQLAQQFVAVSGLSDDEVIGFLGDSVVNAVRNAYGLPLPHNLAPALPQRPTPAQFAQLSSLCHNQVLLASHLMMAANAAAASTSDVSQATLALEVDLMIHAHTCYTSACDMEGIGTIVRTCRVRVPVLASTGQFQQMIHLLTGVGRYREMLFVFESLVEHEKLDLLLRRDTGKEDELKVVLLDFLRKNCPDDSDLFSKVATHYTMWRELAEVLERQGEKELKVLKTHAVDPTMSSPLEGIVRLFVGAAEHYMKKNCLRHAQRCMQKARLASLQRRFLPSSTRVINLQPKELRAFMEEHGNFNESLLVAEAYRSRGLLEWVKPVYTQVVQRGKFRYMQDFTTSLPSTTPLIREVAARYRRDSQLTTLGWATGQRQQYAANMHELLEHVSDPRVACQLAKDLGFTELVSSLLDSQVGQFLQDSGL